MAINLYQYYESILHDELRYIYGDDEEEIEMSLAILLASYSVAGLKTADSLDFDSRGLRCAYLYLYSTSHSHMVIEALNNLHDENYSEIFNLVLSASGTRGSFNITSIGGGPGSDSLGILTFLYEKGFHTLCSLMNVTVVDGYGGWESMFRKVMKKFPVEVNFTAQDLLQPFSPKVQDILQKTNFLSMVKFVSAISGDKYGSISCFTRVFNLLKPGTMILIIDNAGGPDFNQALTLAKSMGLQPVIEPTLHYKFQVPKMHEHGMGRTDYTKRPQTSSTISIAILKKSGSSLNQYLDPILNCRNENLRQERTMYSQGQRIETRKPDYENAENLPPILSRLLLAQQSSNRSTPKTQPSRLSSSSTSGNTRAYLANTSSPQGILTFSGGTRTYTEWPSLSNHPSTTQSRTEVLSSTYWNGNNQVHQESFRSQTSVPAYSGGRRIYTEPEYPFSHQDARRALAMASARKVEIPKKEKSKCCIL